MKATIELDCPREMLLGLHVSAEQFRDEVKLRAATSLYRDGKISSGLASRWLGISRVGFLMIAMRAGAELASDTEDDFRREQGLL